jgi:hypothetical protein
VRGASTSWVSTWGLPPYGALARELNFCNKDVSECGSLSQGENRLSQGRNRLSEGENGLSRV